VPDTAVQTPTDPETAHASHCPPQGESQQTPSTQKPVAHSSPLAQGRPFTCFFEQIPPTQ
jgi:hypothetical protein